MRFISTKTHGIMDLIGGPTLFVVPMFFLHFGAPVVAVPIIAGLLITIMSILTDYEVARRRIIPMSFHLIMDAVLGILMIASPLIFGFWETMWIPHVLVGVSLLVAALCTRTHPANSVYATSSTRVHKPSV